jgi:hypothetical protein
LKITNEFDDLSDVELLETLQREVQESLLLEHHERKKREAGEADGKPDNARRLPMSTSYRPC